MNLIYFLIILGIIVLVHEFGHFIMAKLFGVYVFEFAIGMGPKIFEIKGKETNYTIRLLPLGGFVSLAGEEDVEEKSKEIPEDRLLNNKKIYQRFLIMIFGRTREDLFLLIEVLRTRFFKTKIKIVIVFDIFIFFRNNTHDWNIVV